MSQNFSTEAGAAVRRSNNGIGHAIGVLFKVFFLFIAGVIAFALIMALVALAFSGGGLLDLKGYFLSGFWENLPGLGQLYPHSSSSPSSPS